MNELPSRQHFHIKAQETSPDHNYHDLGHEAEDLLREQETAGIDLVNEPADWINGFDAGFNNRPLVSGNTQHYCEGYLHGQHAWKNPAASPSPSSAASEISSLASLQANTIDPRLLELDIYADNDLFKTPTQLTTANRSGDHKSNIDNGECNSLLSLSLGSPSQSNTRIPRSPAPNTSHSGVHEATSGSGHLFDINSTNFDFPPSTTASDVREDFTPAPSWTPINAHEVSRVHSAPTARTPSPPLVTYDTQGNSNHMTPCIRRSLSLAKRARVEADLLRSQGRLDAAAAAAVEAAHWEKKAHRRQCQTESQRRIRASVRARKLLLRT